MRLPIAALVLLSLHSAAQTPSAPLRAGDTLPGGEHVTSVGLVRVDDDGAWLGLVDSDAANLDQDAFLLRDGLVLEREGMSLTQPAGSTLDDYDFVAAGAPGDLASILKIRPPGGAPTFEGVYFGGELLLQKDELVGDPGLPASTTWYGFDLLQLNRARTLLVLGEIVNPAVAGAREDALARLQLDASGAVVAREVLVTKGQFLPAFGGTVNALGSFDGNLSLAGQGHFLVVVFGTEPAALLLDLDTVLAREGAPAPIPGRSYRSLGLSVTALDDFGHHAFTVELDDGSNCIIRDGQKFVQSGDVLPFLPAPLGRLGIAPLRLANSGDFFWRANDVNGSNGAFVRNLRPIVQVGQTVIDGHLVTALGDRADSFYTSPDGRFFGGLVELGTVGDALVTLDFGLVVPVPGCAGNTGALVKAGGDARAGERLTLSLDHAQSQGALSALLVGTRAARPGPCGISVSGGELLIEPASLLGTFLGAPWTGSPVPFDVDIPASAALVDLELFVQGVFVDTSGVARRHLLSNGLRLEIGAP